MSCFNNKHIVLLILIIVVGIFIYNYDVYVIPKNEPLCKPIYVTKRELSPEIRAELNSIETEIFKEAFENLTDIGYVESFNNLSSQTNYDIPPKSFSTWTIPSITDKHKLRVIESVIKILTYIPTNLNEKQIKELVEYFSIIYETSPNLEIFYKNVASSIKIKEEPYNTKYSHLVLFLIGKFDNDYLSCPIQTNDKMCGINELLEELKEKKTILDQNIQLSQEKTDKTDKLDKPITSNEIIGILKKPIQEQNYPENKILPKINNSISDTKSSYLQEQYSSESNIPKYYPNKPNELTKQTEKNFGLFDQNGLINSKNSLNSSGLSGSTIPTSKCNGMKCTYSCNSSHLSAMNYLDTELKPIETFNGDFASF